MSINIKKKPNIFESMGIAGSTAVFVVWGREGYSCMRLSRAVPRHRPGSWKWNG